MKSTRAIKHLSRRNRNPPTATSAPSAALEELAQKVVAQLARAFESLLEARISERDIYLQIIRAALVGNPSLLGSWSVFEPDAIGGPDMYSAGTLGHDQNGRFMPFWNRADGALRMEPVTGMDRPQQASWYAVPKESLQPCVSEPYLYPMGGRPRWIASAIAPVMLRGKCIGVIGMDWAASSSQIDDSRDPFEAVVHVNGEAEAADRLRALTVRQREVYFWMTQGKSNEEISIILGISAHTVKNHLDQIFQKLGVSNRLAAALAGQIQS
jgi:DNA-binding CsgD family transcriptional regulator